MKEIHVWIDGSAIPNPGHGTYAFIVRWQYDVRPREYTYCGEVGHKVTNNQCEYFALIKALEFLIRAKHTKDFITIFTDSNMLANQMRGDWGFNQGKYKNEYKQALELITFFKKLEFKHIRSYENREADRLANSIHG